MKVHSTPLLLLLAAVSTATARTAVNPNCPPDCSPKELQGVVCGSDGTTYNNRCMLNMISCYVPSLVWIKDGPCTPGYDDEPIATADGTDDTSGEEPPFGFPGETDEEPLSIISDDEAPLDFGPDILVDEPGEASQTPVNDSGNASLTPTTQGPTSTPTGSTSAPYTTSAPSVVPPEPVVMPTGSTPAPYITFPSSVVPPEPTVTSTGSMSASYTTSTPSAVLPEPTVTPTSPPLTPTITPPLAPVPSPIPTPSITTNSTSSLQEQCESTRCPSKYAPICASNNVSYSNVCIFSVAQCIDPTLTVQFAGECFPVSPPPSNTLNATDNAEVDICDFKCAEVFAPVCNAIGKIYDNRCVYAQAVCRDTTTAIATAEQCVSLLSP